jgi:hypothetical protein
MSNNDLGMVHFFAMEANGCIAMSSRKEICKHFALKGGPGIKPAVTRFFTIITHFAIFFTLNNDRII